MIILLLKLQLAMRSFFRDHLKKYTSFLSYLGQREAWNATVTTESDIKRLSEQEDLVQNCPSVEINVKPIRAKNMEGDWRIMIQDVGFITQVERMTLCLQPQETCHLEGSSLLGCQRSYCKQLKLARSLLAYDPCNPRKGIFVDDFDLPSDCSCSVFWFLC